MAIIGLILIAVGIALFFVQKNYSTKLQNIRSATASTAAELQRIAGEIATEIGSGNLREYVKIRGRVRCANPLISELKELPCVYYSMRVVREYEEDYTTRDSDGKTRRETRRGSETISSNTQSIPFILQDRSGEITVNPNDGNIETVQVLDEFRRENTSGSSSLSFGSFTLSISGVFGSGGRRTLGYLYTESILPCDREVLVIGTAADDGEQVTLRKPTAKDKKFIISLKSEEELSQDTANAAKGFFYGMIAAFVVGVILVIVGLVAG